MITTNEEFSEKGSFQTHFSRNRLYMNQVSLTEAYKAKFGHQNNSIKLTVILIEY